MQARAQPGAPGVKKEERKKKKKRERERGKEEGRGKRGEVEREIIGNRWMEIDVDLHKRKFLHSHQQRFCRSNVIC